ncbi:MAG: helix-turn-helix domain-containing protein [Pseudomonas sp.]|uniref:helix-turn-helix domain-containing protein n=1 Tax=Pseudomonas sp. TaxID=306 RepID=UPI003D0A604B
MTQPAVKALGKRIKGLRVDRGWTQATLAEALGCESMTVSRYERGEYAPSVEVLEQIATVLGVGIGEFFTVQEEAEPNAVKLRHDLCDIAYAADEKTLGKIMNAAKKILSNKE